LTPSLDKAIFDEKFQINTLLECDAEGTPCAEKLGMMTVCFDKSLGGTELCEISFNMADFKFGEYKILRLFMKKCPQNNVVEIEDDEVWLDIGLKGTKSQGLLKASLKK
jgi:hypothetical protein